ncbi:MAG: Unknown protein [uncultured Aureispira sp.]|uniref:Lipoprotein n=1 Tax=uncultured Aureispira sp. TaxID=1331704 RepID=A0A6S6SL83_9BACT|nr:MAG: Unknown protein [uncultured Aureispira sp.]
MRLTFVLKKPVIFLFSLFVISSCTNEKEATLLEVLEAIEQDKISTIVGLCTPKAFKQIEARKRTFQSLLIHDWDLRFNHLKCSEGETLANCTLCDDYENCTPLDYLKLRNTDGKWLVDYNEFAPTVVVERFLGYLAEMDFEAAKKISGPRLKKELEAIELVVTLMKETGNFSQKELKDLKKNITTITSFNPALEWLKCRDDAAYPATKICFLCNSLFGETNKAIRVTRMRDKKWYVEYYSE